MTQLEVDDGHFTQVGTADHADDVQVAAFVNERGDQSACYVGAASDVQQIAEAIATGDGEWTVGQFDVREREDGDEVASFVLTNVDNVDDTMFVDVPPCD